MESQGIIYATTTLIIIQPVRLAFSSDLIYVGSRLNQKFMETIKKIIQSKIAKRLFWLAFWGGNLLLVSIFSIIFVSLFGIFLIPWAQIASSAFRLFLILDVLFCIIDVLFCGHYFFIKQKKTLFLRASFFIASVMIGYTLITFYDYIF
jgi:hypothetical protein